MNIQVFLTILDYHKRLLSETSHLPIRSLLYCIWRRNSTGSFPSSSAFSKSMKSTTKKRRHEVHEEEIILIFFFVDLSSHLGGCTLGVEPHFFKCTKGVGLISLSTPAGLCGCARGPALRSSPTARRSTRWRRPHPTDQACPGSAARSCRWSCPR